MAEQFSLKEMANVIAEDAVTGATAGFQSEFQDYSRKSFAQNSEQKSESEGQVAKATTEAPKTSVSERVVCGTGVAAWAILAADVARDTVPVAGKVITAGLGLGYAYVCRNAMKDTALSVKDSVIGK